eukprot:14627535-Heterocapsa_arctica.AAC.1
MSALQAVPKGSISPLPVFLKHAHSTSCSSKAKQQRFDKTDFAATAIGSGYSDNGYAYTGYAYATW